MLRILALVLGLVLGLLLGALVFLHFADLNPYRERVAGWVSGATGREFAIGGDLDLDLWPDLSLSVADVSLANASWGSEPEMLQLGQLRLRLRPWSLLSQPVEVVDFLLQDVDVLLESDAEGHSNWDLAGEQAPGEEPAREAPDDGEAGGDGGIGLVLDRAELRSVRLRQRSPDAPEQVVNLALLTLAESKADSLALVGDGQVLDMPLKLSGQLGPRRQLAETGAGDFGLALALGETRLDLSGKASARDAEGSRRVTASLEATDLDALLQRLEVPLSEPGPLSLQGELMLTGQGSDGRLEGTLGEVALQATLHAAGDELVLDSRLGTLEQLGVLLGVSGLPAEPLQLATTLDRHDASVDVRDLQLSLGDVRLSGHGRVAADFSESALTLEANGTTLSGVRDSLPALPFKLSASLDTRPGVIELAPLRASLGGSDLRGSLRLAGGAERALTAQLRSNRLDLVELAGGEGDEDSGDEGSAGTEPEAEPGAPEGQGEEADRIFSSEPLDLSFLTSNRIDLKWQVGELVSRGMRPSAVDLVARLQGGELKVDLDFSGEAGGVGENRLRLRAEGDQAQLQVDSRLRDLRVNLASGDVDKVRDIPPIDLTFELQARGNSPHALAASSEGELLITLGEGLMANNVLGVVAGDVFAQLAAALNPFAKTETHTEFQCGAIKVDIQAGVAELDPLFLQSEKLQINAAGTVDLDTEQLKLEFNTKPRKGVGVSADMFVTPFVALEGSLAHPRVGLNAKSSALTAGAAVATGGMSLLWKRMLDRAAAEVDQCKDTLSEYTHPPLRGG